MAAADADVMDRPAQVDDDRAVTARHAAPVQAEERLSLPAPTTMAFIIARLDDDKLYNTKELAKALGFLSHRSLERYRCRTGRGGGPAYTQSGGGLFAKGKVVYLGRDVKAWLLAGYVAPWHDADAAERDRERKRRQEARRGR